MRQPDVFYLLCVFLPCKQQSPPRIAHIINASPTDERQPLRFSGAPWYVYLVGAMGIGIVATSSWCTLHVGASAFMALSTAGQLVSSALIDRFGLFGMPVTRIRRRQLPGYALVLLGVILVVLN